MSVYLKPGMQSHHMLGNSPSNLLGNVSTSLAQPGVMEPTTQPLTADPSAQPADAYVVKHPPAKRHLGQRGGLVGGVLLTAGLLLGAASLSKPTVDIDHIPDGLTRYLGDKVPGLGNTEMTSAQLFAELDGKMVPMEVVSGTHSDLLSGGTLASAGTNFATILASAKPKGKWGKFKKWAGNNKGTKWLQKKLKKPAGWVKKHPFAAMGIIFGLFLLYSRKSWKYFKLKRSKNGKKIYQNDIPKGQYFDTGTIFIANCEVSPGQFTLISSNEAQRNLLVGFTQKPAMRLTDVLKKLYKEDSDLYNQAKLNAEQIIVGEHGWLVELSSQPGEDRRYNLTLAPYEVGFWRRRGRFWNETRKDKNLDDAKYLVMRDQTSHTLPWTNRWLKWMPGVMSLKKANKIVEKANETIVVSNPEIVGSIGNGKMTATLLRICYTSDGDKVTIHRANNDPWSLPEWQGKTFKAIADKDPGPKLSIIMLPIASQHPEVSEDTVKNFLGELVKAGYATETDGHYKLEIHKGSDEDANRISGDKEAVAFYAPPPPKPEPQKPQYRMTDGNSVMLIGTPDGTVKAVEGWGLRVLSAAKEPITPDKIFESIGMTADERQLFDLFIQSAIDREWLRNLDSLGVDFILVENPNLERRSQPAQHSPRHPKAVPAIKKDGTDTGDWTGMLPGHKTPSAPPASAPKVAPASSPPEAASPEPETGTRIGVAGTVLAKDPAKASMPRGAKKAPEAPRVQAKPLVPVLKIPLPAAVHAAASVTAPPAPETEKAGDLIKNLPGPRNKETVVLSGSKVDGLAGDSKPQTGVPTRAELRAGTRTDPQLLTKRVGPKDEGPATLAVTFDKPANVELNPDDQSTGKFVKPAPEATPPPEASLPLEDRRVKDEGDAKKLGPSPRGRKAKVIPAGERRPTVVAPPEGVAGNTMKLSSRDFEEMIVPDGEGDGSDEG